MIEKVYGNVLSVGILKDVVGTIEASDIQGTLYFGYPVLGTLEENVVIECLLISDAFGVVVIDSLGGSPKEIEDRQDRIYFALKTHLSKFGSLREKRELAVPILVVSIVGEIDPSSDNLVLATPENIVDVLEGSSTSTIAPNLMKNLNACLQCIVTLRPKKARKNVTKNDSRGSKIRSLEEKIANLDRWQKQAALETPEGPQRIRGLAGTGKTIVLALKAAYLHAKNPEWQIGVTFYTKALYQQFSDLIGRFFREHSTLDPDDEQLQILHSWGSSWSQGVYNLFAGQLAHPARDFSYAKSVFGYEKAFRGVCRELLAFAEKNPIEPVFDAFLIDEAQDLPPEFFKLVYLFTKDPKRVVWAYDELQNLSDENGLPSLPALFGKDENGNAVVSLENKPSHPREDIVLPVCYRNTPWNLTTAHAIGFGVYREPGGLIQHFDDPQLWIDIGYEVLSHSCKLGEKVELRRDAGNTPSFFEELLDPDDSVIFKGFPDQSAELNWVGEQVAKNIFDEELDPDDIMVIFPVALGSRDPSLKLHRILAKNKVQSHVVGTTSSSDEMFVRGSVSISHIYRAKGNEAPMVYVVSAQRCGLGSGLPLKRNALFAGMTRSRAWVRVTGYGDGMIQLIQEQKRVVENEYKLDFLLPTSLELESLRKIHSDLSPEEKKKREKQRASLEKIIQSIKEDGLTIQDVSPDIAKQLREILGGE